MNTFVTLTVLCVYASLLIELVFYPIPSIASTRQLLSGTHPQNTTNSLLGTVQKLSFMKKFFLLVIPATIGIITFFIPLLVISRPALTNNLFRLGLLEQDIIVITGIVLAVAGRGITLSSAYYFRKRTPPNKNTGLLVTHGIFSHSRNPIATGLLITYFGFFLTFPSIVLLAGFFVFAGNMHFRILLEEDYLKHADSRDYEQYRNRTRRYL